MKPCRRVGVNLSWRCNWRCKTCFYRRFNEFDKPIDRSIKEITEELGDAILRGCDHTVAVGYGEPMLYPKIYDFIEACKDIGLSSSIITNGTAPLPRYEKLFDTGVNHLHVSMHGVGDIIDTISERGGSGEKQKALRQWLKSNDLPWRSNTTLQLLNYKHLEETISAIVDAGAFHIVLLGFLPHYQWQNKLKEVAVHPAELRPYIEQCCEILEQSGRLFTLRYHPFCHISQEYWKYIVNARYVLYDPWEWDYEKLTTNENRLWADACAMGDSVGVQGSPCHSCAVKLHCGGWNRHYAAGFDGADLKPIKLEEISEDDTKKVTDQPGFYHDQNPANHGKGYK